MYNNSNTRAGECTHPSDKLKKSVDCCLLTSAVCSVEMCERNSCVDLLVVCCASPVCV